MVGTPKPAASEGVMPAVSPDLLTFNIFDHFYGEKSCFWGTKEVLSEID